MFLNFRNNIISYRIKFRKDGDKNNFTYNISAHKNTLGAKRNIFHIFRNRIRIS